MIGNLISPKIGLALIKKRLEKQLKITITKYQVIYQVEKKEVGFKLGMDYFQYESDNLISIIESYLDKYKEKELKDLRITFIIINYPENDLNIYYLSPDGKRQFITKKL